MTVEGELLVGEDQHHVFEQRGSDGRHVGFGGGVQVEARHLGAQGRRQGAEIEVGHDSTVLLALSPCSQRDFPAGASVGTVHATPLEVPMLLAEISFSQSFQDMFDDLATFIPKLVGAIVIFVIGWFVARIIRKVLHRGLTKLGVDGLVDRSGLGAPLERAGYADSGLLLARIVYVGLMLLVLQLAIDVLDITAIEDVLDDIIAFIPKIFVAIVIVFITGAIANFVKDFVGGLTEQESWGNLATNVATGAIWVIGIFAALDQIQVAQDVVDTMFTALAGSLALILVIKFGVGGIWAARDRFWPAVYDKIGDATGDTSAV